MSTGVDNEKAPTKVIIEKSGDFHGTGIEIWAGFGPVWQLLRPVFSCFHGQNKNFKNIVDVENIFGIELS